MAERAPIYEDELDEPVLTPDGMLVRQLPDGGLEIDMEGGEEEEEPGPAADAENLAESLDPNENSRIAQRIVELVDLDIRSREQWMKKFKDGLEMSALIGEGGGKALMEGGATVVHPLIAEAAVQFQARALAELFPATGPVKGQIIGRQTEELLAQADRLAGHMNWQMLEEDEGYFEDVDQMLLVLPLAGSTFKKTYFDELAGIVTSRYISGERVILPYRASSLRRAPRVTHWLEFDEYEMGELQDSGFYLSAEKAKLQKPMDPGGTEFEQKAENKEAATDEQEDGVHHVYETAIRWKLPGTDEYKEYLITVSRDDQRTLAIRENWKERDGRKKRRERFTHYRYLPGIGVYGWGLFHYIGSLGKAATDTVRSMLDTAAMAAWGGGFATKEAKALGNEIRIKAGTYQTVDLTAEEISKAFYTPNFGKFEPAQVQLFELLVQAGQRFGSTTEAMVGEGDQNTPVGTTIARIEQASKVYSGIHKRVHDSARHEFRLRAELNYEHLADAQKFTLGGSNLEIYPEDYDGRVDIVPVSDPNIVSTPQRIALAQGALELARQNPANFDVREAERRYLEAMQTPDIERLMPDKSAIPMLDPISENARILTGQAAKAYPEQNHQAHIMVHTALAEQIVGSPVEQIAAPVLQAHIAEHMAQQYRVAMSMQLGINIPDPSMTEPGQESPVPPEVQDAIGLAAAQMIAQQQAQAAQQGPDPESALKLAQADKTKAETEEVRQRTQAAAMQAQEGEQAAAQMIQPLMEQIAAAEQALAAAEQALAENAKRDQKVEQALMNLMATVQALEEREAEKESAAHEEAEARKTEEQRQAEGEKAKAEHAKQMEKLQRQIDELQQSLKERDKEAKIREEERAKAEKEREKKEKEGAAAKPAEPAPQLPPITIGPIVIEKAAGAKTIEIKKTGDGKYVGTAKNDGE